jgi:hypothetical protein
MNFQNTNSTHIKLEGFRTDTQQWVQIEPFIARGGTGTSDWKYYTTNIHMPDNVEQIRVVLNAGWVLDPINGPAVTRFGEFEIYRVKDMPQLDSILLHTGLGSESDYEPVVEDLTYDKTNPTLWTANLTSNGPFTLAFAEGYHPAWEATVYRDGVQVETAKSIPLYSMMNGFQISEAGDLEIRLQYKPQLLFNLIGLFVLIGSLIILFYYLMRHYQSALRNATYRVGQEASG